MKYRFSLTILILTLLTTACWNDKRVQEKSMPDPSTIAQSPLATASRPPSPSPSPTPPVVYRATLAAIGDVLIHNTVYQDAYDDKTGSYDFKPMLEPVRELLRKPDILVANSESIIGGKELGLSSYPQFNSPQEVGDALQDAGVDLVTLANNHTMDKREAGILAATAYWDKLGIPYTGAFRSKEDAEQQRFLTGNGIRFGFLAYTYGTNGIPVPQAKPYLVNLIDPEKMKQDIAAIKKDCDVTVVSVHWGVEYQLSANDDQRVLAQQLADWGADIIIGTHPHVLQTMEWLDSNDGRRTLVMYSLGNFLSAQDKMAQLLGGIGQVGVVKTVKDGQTTVALESPAFIPTYNKYKNWRTYRVTPLSQLTQEDWKAVAPTWEGIMQRMQKAMPELSIIL